MASEKGRPMTKPIWVHDDENTDTACCHSSKSAIRECENATYKVCLAEFRWPGFASYTGIRKRDVKDGPVKFRLTAIKEN